MTLQPRFEPTSRPGRMTAIMRAAPQSRGPKQLRIGVVRQGRIIDERLLGRREHVTVGSTERATVMVSAPGFPACIKLLTARASGYDLHTIEGMTGRISTSDGASSLRELLAADVASSRTLHLDQDTRGRITLGDTTVLFQFVTPAPVPARIPLPASVRTTPFGDIDWLTTVVAAFSFLLHFFLVALVYSDWTDQVVDNDIVVAQLVETVKSLPPPPAVEKPVADTNAEASAQAKVAPKAQAAAKGRGNGAKGRPGRAGQRGAGNARAAEIASQLRALELDTLTALGAEGPSTRAVMREGGVPIALLEDQARSRRGADDDPGGLDIGGGEGSDSVEPGMAQRDIREIGATERSKDGGATRVGVARQTEGPRGSAIVAPPSVAGSTVANAGAVVAGMRGRFRRCYQRGLDENPELAGAVNLVARIGPNGEVQSVGGGGGGLGLIVPCLKAVVSSGAFSPPSGGSSAVLSIPIQFVKR